MENIVQFMESNMVPYHKSKLKFVVDGCGDNNIIIPGAVVLFKSPRMFEHSDQLITLARQITTIINEIPQEYCIYIYIESADIDIYMKKLSDQLSESEISFCEVINKQTITNIGFYDFSCVVDKCGPMWTMAVDKEIRDRYQQFQLHTNEQTYDNSTIIMNDEELVVFKSINFTFKPPEYKTLCFMSPKQIGKGQQLFYNFTFSFPNKPLPGGKRNPIRHVEGRTDICQKCNRLMYLKYINMHHDCVACKNSEL
jgi:hypothetical protein